MLFFKECKKVVHSLAFVIYCIAIFAFFFTQFHEDCQEPLPKPAPGLDNYGMIAKEIPEILMPAATDSLVIEYLSGSFKAYPYGFYKEVHLKEKKKSRLEEIIAELTGMTPDELDSIEDFEHGGYYMDEKGYMMYQEPNVPGVNIPETLTYERFRQLMSEADKIIGGGSKYCDSFIVENFSVVPKTYEDALTEYDEFINEDKITGAYARLFCDYMGIILSILPVFAAVHLANLDRRSRMEQLAYSRKISSAKLIFTRYFALVAVMLIPVLCTVVLAGIQIKRLYPDNVLDNTAILKYAFCWLVPNIMTASAVGMLVTELASGLLAIFIQGALWFSSTIAAVGGLTGNIRSFTFVMRHNSLSDRNAFISHLDTIAFNRCFYAAVSLLAVALTAIIYEKKRRGGFNAGKFSLQNYKRTLKA